MLYDKILKPFPKKTTPNSSYFNSELLLNANTQLSTISAYDAVGTYVLQARSRQSAVYVVDENISNAIFDLESRNTYTSTAGSGAISNGDFTVEMIIKIKQQAGRCYPKHIQ